ncbi:MAG: sugar phosphate nucleotidyltransferase [Phycisphaerae bacterium]
MICKAVVPIAGLGTRMLPVTKAYPKALLPLVDASGRLRTVLDAILASAAAGGCDEAAVIVSPHQLNSVRAVLAQLRAESQVTLPSVVEFLVQPEPGGFGDAVMQAEDFVAGRPFLLLLGDHIHTSEPGSPSPVRQLCETFDQQNAVAATGMQVVDESELAKVGVAAGESVDGRTFRCTAFVEKPSADQARAMLTTPGLPDGKYLAHNGMYAFSAELFAYLHRLEDPQTSGELQLAAAQSLMLKEHPSEYFLFHAPSISWDTGNPTGYAAAFSAFRRQEM